MSSPTMPSPTPSTGHSEPILDLLWPASASAGHLRYQALPSGTQPRFVIPSGSRRLSVAGLLSLRDSSTSRARRRNKILAAAWGRGWTPGDSISLPSGGITGALSDLLNTEVSCAVHLGPPRANRKPVIAAMSDEGEVLAFAKVGVSPLTDRLVSNEARALRHIATVPGLIAPLLLKESTWSEHPLVVQSPLDRSSSKTDSAAMRAAQVALSSSGEGSISHYLKSLNERIDALVLDATEDESDAPHRLRKLFDTTAQHPEIDDLTVGPWHGDWRATNAQVTAAGVAVWDWERFSSAAPRGFDALHLGLTQHSPSEPNLARLVPWLLQQAPATLRSFAVDTKPAELVVTLYLLEIATRYLEDGQARSGARLGDVSTWLLPALESHLQVTP